MKLVKKFYAYSDNIDDNINYWLRKNPDCEFIDIKFQVYKGSEYALLIYDKKDNTKI